MLQVILLTAALAVFRLLGWTGVEELDSWQATTRAALATTFGFAGARHFTRLRHDFVKMLPLWLAQPMAVVYFTGACEILGAAGILIPGTRRAAGLSLALLLVVMFPANIRAARQGIPFGGRPPSPLLLRAAVQAVLIVLAVWSTRPR